MNFFCCVGVGGVIGLMALNALFVLIQDYNLYVPLHLSPRVLAILLIF